MLQVLSFALALLMASVVAEDDTSPYVAPAYFMSGVVKAFKSVPRIGGYVNFPDIFSQESNEYVMSTMLIAIVVISCIAFWLLLLLVFKILGPDRLCACGYDIGLAGNSIQKPDLVALHALHPLATARRYEDNSQFQDPTLITEVTETNSQIMNAQEQEHWSDKVETIEKRVRRMRLAALFFASVLIVASVLATIFGVVELKRIGNAGKDFTGKMTSIFRQASVVTGDLIERGEVAISDRNAFVENLNNFCPNCDASGEVMVNDGDLKIVPVAYEVNALTNSLEPLGDFGLSKAMSIQFGFSELSSTLDDMKGQIEEYEWLYPVSITFLALLACIAATYMVGIVMAWKERSGEKFQWVQTYVLVPFFILFIIASVVFCSLLSIAVVMDADFCTGGSELVGSPGETIQSILDEKSYDTESSFYKSAIYISTGCTSDHPTTALEALQPSIETAIASSDAFQQRFGDFYLVNLSDALGISIEQLSLTLGQSQTFEKVISDMHSDVNEITDTVACQSMSPDFVSITDDAICNDGAQALVWMFACLGAIAVSGMSLLTLRVSWRDVVDFVDPEDIKDFGDGSAANSFEFGGTSEGSPDEQGTEVLYGHEDMAGSNIEDMVVSFASEDEDPTYYR